MIDRPCVALAVLQTPWLLSKQLNNDHLHKTFVKHHLPLKPDILILYHILEGHEKSYRNKVSWLVKKLWQCKVVVCKLVGFSEWCIEHRKGKFQTAFPHHILLLL